MRGEKQAVIVVHGMGEQRPMGTIRRVVEALWTSDSSLVKPCDKQKEQSENESWIVPDLKTGSYDLQRITTPKAADGQRTDFFEFYYADILDDTKLLNLMRWFLRILAVHPAHISQRMFWPWSALCFLILLIGIIAVGALGLVLGQIFDIPWHEATQLNAFDVAIISVLNFALIFWISRLGPLARSIAQWSGYALIILIIGYIVIEASSVWANWLIIMAALLITILTAWVFLPYLGDVAGYLGAYPDTVRRRHEIRERGLRLLRELHKDPAYSRIVIVAHSLGSVVAYDILHLLWEELGPTNENPPSERVRRALYEHDIFVKNNPQARWDERTIKAYQEKQAEVARAIRLSGPAKKPKGEQSQSYWKISDFVTLGSPLSHAEFLIAQGAENFKKLKQERLFPMAPPFAYNEDFGALYTPDDLELCHTNRHYPVPQTTEQWALEAPRAYAHHGAVFSAVRWTNMYDTHHPVFFWLGDVISGPVGGDNMFGRGIREHDLKITYSKFGIDHARFITHTLYWRNTAKSGVASHIKKLRQAVGLLQRR